MTNAKTPTLGRREALARLGLSIVVAYSAPTVLQLDRQAGAVQPSCTGKGKGKGNPWCKGKGARDNRGPESSHGSSRGSDRGSGKRR